LIQWAILGVEFGRHHPTFDADHKPSGKIPGEEPTATEYAFSFSSLSILLSVILFVRSLLVEISFGFSYLLLFLLTIHLPAFFFSLRVLLSFPFHFRSRAKVLGWS
jgi:hypothetical protein